MKDPAHRIVSFRARVLSRGEAVAARARWVTLPPVFVPLSVACLLGVMTWFLAAPLDMFRVPALCVIVPAVFYLVWHRTAGGDAGQLRIGPDVAFHYAMSQRRPIQFRLEEIAGIVRSDRQIHIVLHRAPRDLYFVLPRLQVEDAYDHLVIALEARGLSQATWENRG